MSLRICLDMNLSPDWVSFLQSHSYECAHWSTVGNPRATDQEIVSWAIANEYLIMTHDLDFGTILSLTHATGPSVILLRSHNVLPNQVGDLVLSAMKQYAQELASGALVVIDSANMRIRILPIWFGPVFYKELA